LIDWLALLFFKFTILLMYIHTGTHYIQTHSCFLRPILLLLLLLLLLRLK
jgi:uncharacterized membrane protein